MTFKEGDRVKTTTEVGYVHLNGSSSINYKGTVTLFRGLLRTSVGVIFDMPIEGHTLSGHLPSGSKKGWWCQIEELKLIPTKITNWKKELGG